MRKQCPSILLTACLTVVGLPACTRTVTPKKLHRIYTRYDGYTLGVPVMCLYQGTAEGFHYFRIETYRNGLDRPPAIRRYRVRTRELHLARTFPLTKDADRWITFVVPRDSRPSDEQPLWHIDIDTLPPSGAAGEQGIDLLLDTGPIRLETGPLRTGTLDLPVASPGEEVTVGADVPDFLQDAPLRAERSEWETAR